MYLAGIIKDKKSVENKSCFIISDRFSIYIIDSMNMLRYS